MAPVSFCYGPKLCCGFCVEWCVAQGFLRAALTPEDLITMGFDAQEAECLGPHCRGPSLGGLKSQKSGEIHGCRVPAAPTKGALPRQWLVCDLFVVQIQSTSTRLLFASRTFGSQLARSVSPMALSTSTSQQSHSPASQRCCLCKPLFSVAICSQLLGGAL